MAKDLLRTAARSTSPAGRALLLKTSEELARENARTLAFFSQFRLPNPVRAAYAETQLRTDEEPRGEALSDEDREMLRALHFHPGAIYYSPRLDLRFERWIGPDGCVICEFGKSGRFFTTHFDDDHRVSMWPDVASHTRELLHTTMFLENSDDIVADYGRMLEAVADYADRSGARPLYRFEDPDLDERGLDYYARYQVTLKYAAHALKARARNWVSNKVAASIEGLQEHASSQGMEAIAKYGFRAEATTDGTVFTCSACDAKNRVPHEKIGRVATCASCAEPLPTTEFPIDAHSLDAVDHFLRGCPVPVMIDFWAPWCGPCIAGMPMLIEAAAQSDGRFAILRVNGDEQPLTVARYRIKAFPTLIRVIDNAETSRSAGTKTTQKIVAFAVHNDVPPSADV